VFFKPSLLGSGREGGARASSPQKAKLSESWKEESGRLLCYARVAIIDLSRSISLSSAIGLNGLV
jgi:hypothetical protein